MIGSKAPAELQYFIAESQVETQPSTFEVSAIKASKSNYLPVLSPF